MKVSLFVLALLPAVVFATLGVDISQPTSQAAFSCMKSNGYSFAVARVHMSTGHVDPNGAATIGHAWAAGMAHVDGYIFPCPHCGNAAQQVRNTVAALKGTKYGMLWLDIEGTQYWKDQSYNRQFFLELVAELRAQHVNFGVYTSASQWNPIMGSFTGGAQLPLWYAHYDGSPSFGDFHAFGGWTHPAIKQYRGDITLCGAGVDTNWYP